MAGLYDNPGMTQAQTNAHWKREQDNYLIQIGAMDLIKKDPMAALGYKIRSANPDRTLQMGGNADESKYYGLYKFNQGSHGGLDYAGPRFDGTLDVSVGLPPQHYGATIAHELGHVGSRNSQTDRKISSNPNNEELRQRLVDYVNNPPGSTMSRDAVWFLATQFGLDSYDKIEKAAAPVREALKKPKKKQVATAPSQE